MTYRSKGKAILLGVVALLTTLLGLSFLVKGLAGEEPAGRIVLASTMFGLAGLVIQRAWAMRVAVAGTRSGWSSSSAATRRIPLADIPRMYLEVREGSTVPTLFAQLRDGRTRAVCDTGLAVADAAGYADLLRTIAAHVNRRIERS